MDYELQMKLEDSYNNKQQQKLSEKAVYCKNDKELYNLIFGQLHSDIIAAVKNFSNPLFETVNKEQDVVGLLFIVVSVCIKNLLGTKVEQHFDALEIISSTLTYTQKQCISNNDFGDVVIDQVLATMSQYSVFIFGEYYHAKVLHNNDGFTLVNYDASDQLGKNKYG